MATPEDGLRASEKVRLSIIKAFRSEKITASYLAKKLKQELNAKETKVFLGKESEEVIYSKGLVAWDVRQKARIDAHKLMGHYPAEKHEVTGKEGRDLFGDFAERLTAAFERGKIGTGAKED